MRSSSAAPLNVDLAVTVVHGPPAMSGQAATFTWTVVNQGSDAAAGPWVDSVYLSPSAALDGSALLLGQVAHSAVLAPGASYDASLTQALPLLPDGSYHILVVSDNAGEVADANRANNTAVAPTSVTINIPTLPMDTNVTGAIAAGQDVFYRLQPPQGRDILITGDFAVAFQVGVLRSLRRAAAARPVRRPRGRPGGAQTGAGACCRPSPPPSASGCTDRPRRRAARAIRSGRRCSASACSASARTTAATPGRSPWPSRGPASPPARRSAS